MLESIGADWELISPVGFECLQAVVENSRSLYSVHLSYCKKVHIMNQSGLPI